MRATVAPLTALWAAGLVLGACSPSNDAGVKAEEPASAPVAAPPAAPPVPAAAAAPADPAFAGDIDARGTEPFWGVQVRAGKLTLTRPDHPDVTAPHQGPRLEGDAAVFGVDGLRLTLRKGDCSDGMSDNTYPLTAEVVVAGETLKGCAAPA
jgi:uncharacterized membrane protein